MVASIVTQGNQLLLTGTSQLEALSSLNMGDWHECLCNSKTSLDWQLQIQVSGLVKNICITISAPGKALAVSDGSFQHTNGAAAWIIKGTMLTDMITG